MVTATVPGRARAWAKEPQARGRRTAGPARLSRSRVSSIRARTWKPAARRARTWVKHPKPVPTTTTPGPGRPSVPPEVRHRTTLSSSSSTAHPATAAKPYRSTHDARRPAPVAGRRGGPTRSSSMMGGCDSGSSWNHSKVPAMTISWAWPGVPRKRASTPSSGPTTSCGWGTATACPARPTHGRRWPGSPARRRRSAWDPRHIGDLPFARTAGHHRGPGRRHERWPGGTGSRAGWVRGRTSRLRHPLPTAQGALRRSRRN